MQWFPTIIVAYVFCHGVTAFVVSPVETMFAPEVSAFASLLYLPHGVRVLSAWFFGWKAFPPLLAGEILSDIVFTEAAVTATHEAVFLWSAVIGAGVAPLAFSLLALAGLPLRAGQGRLPDWKWLLVVGALSSVLSSIGQTFVFSGLVLPENFVKLSVFFALGDLAGLFACLYILMLIFRWIRLYRPAD